MRVAEGPEPAMGRVKAGVGPAGRVNTGVMVRGGASACGGGAWVEPGGVGALSAGGDAPAPPALGRGPTRNGDWGIFGQALLREYGLESSGPAMVVSGE